MDSNIRPESGATMIYMSEFPLRALSAAEFPARLREIPQPPETLYCRGELPPAHLTPLAVVGSRHYTTYGKQVVEHLVSGLASYDVAIVSGLALGIDSLAHEAALRHNLYTLAVPGSGLNDAVIYPASHKALARRILEADGGLLSEFPPLQAAAPWTFPKRNRIMAGYCVATLMIEAGEKSGTLITARMTVDYNRELLVVPGSIFSDNSKGPHQFLALGATLVTSAEDIATALALEPRTKLQPALNTSLTEVEAVIINALKEPTSIEVLASTIKIEMQTLNVTLMKLEITGYVAAEHGIIRRLR